MVRKITERMLHYRLKKNTAQLFTLFALSNLWMVRGKLMEVRA
jgi:IS5 family transposase